MSTSNDSKKYHYIKMPTNFYMTRFMQKVRKQENGPVKMVIVTKIILLSLPEGCYIRYEGIEETLEDEIALAIDEDAEAVKETVELMISSDWLKKMEDGSLFFTKAQDMACSFTSRNLRYLREKARAVVEA